MEQGEICQHSASRDRTTVAGKCQFSHCCNFGYNASRTIYNGSGLSHGKSVSTVWRN
jgi:hypothetical protein